MTTITQADRDAVNAFHNASFTALFSDGGDKQAVGGNMNKAHTLLLEAFAAHREASEARACEEGAKAMQAVEPALYQLRNHQQQADMDGTFVTVSRQALDEVLDAIAALDPAQIAGGEK